MSVAERDGARPADGGGELVAVQRAMTLAVDRLNEEKERAPCLPDEESTTMKVAKRVVPLDLLMAGWGLGTWLGVNGLFVQLPLLVEQQPEGWGLPTSMALAVQLANTGLLIYALLKRLLPRLADAPYIYALLAVGTASLALNAFLHGETAPVGGSDASVAFLALTYCTALVGCTSSVLFYPFLRYYRDVYLATYLVGEGLSGFIPSILALIQGVGGDPECVPSEDNSTLVAVYPPPRFDSTVFLLLLAALSAFSLACFALVDRWPGFLSERAQAGAAAKEDEAAPREPLLRPRWLAVMAMMSLLNAVMNGLMPSVQPYSCIPYGRRAYHLAVTLGAMANPTACLAGVWLRPMGARALAALLAAAAVPLSYILATALLSPEPPLQHAPLGEVLIVASWVSAAACLSYARMWVYTWARGGGAAGMRACGAFTQAGSALGSLTFFFVINYSGAFTQPDACPAPGS